MLFYLAICLLSQTRYIFAHAQMRYNLPCGRLRYDINPFTPERAYRIEDISHAARVYRKSRKGFISLRSVLMGTTLMGGALKDILGSIDIVPTDRKRTEKATAISVLFS